MKVVILGDIHGRKIWKDIIKEESDADRFIFLGDYFDPYDLTTPQDMLTNFEEIVNFKYDNPETILLTGNHDLHYISSKVRPCSRFSEKMYHISHEFIASMVEDGTLQLCHKIARPRHIWCSHAGFTNTWLRDNRLQLNEKELNEHFRKACKGSNNPYAFLDKGYHTNGYGDDVYQSPLWVRPTSLSYDSPIDIYQVVGHTMNQWSENIKLSKVTLCDSLRWNQYYVYDFKGPNETFTAKQIK